MNKAPENPEKIIFDITLTKAEFDRFFDAVDWSLPFRPTCPPTIATIFRDGEFEILKKLNVPLKKVLHGEQKYRFNETLKPDTAYQCESFLTSFIEKNKMTFLILQTNIIETSTRKIAIECSSTVIARGLKDSK